MKAISWGSIYSQNDPESATNISIDVIRNAVVNNTTLKKFE